MDPRERQMEDEDHRRGRPLGAEIGMETAEGFLDRGEVEIPNQELSTGFVIEERNVPIEATRDSGPFSSDPEVDVARKPGSFGMTAVDVETDVGEFKRLQKHIGTELSGFDVDRDEFYRGDVDWDKVGSMAESLERGEGEIPIPWVEVNLEGDLIGTQEGRHRALAAEQAGLDRIPFRILVNTKKLARDDAERIENEFRARM